MSTPDTHLGSAQALAEEFAELRRRRPAQQDNLVGLAFSGGGIRSATFGLGVLESLKRCGVLKHVDYLSTVSGGGYIGAWFSAACARIPGWLEPSSDWMPSIAHLRRYSNYLSPQVGFFSADTWSMLTIWLRNTLLIQLTVVLALGCLLLVPRPLFELFLHWPDVGNLRWATIFLFLLGVVGIAGNQLRITSQYNVRLLRATSWTTGLGIAVVCVGAVYAFGSAVGFDPFHDGEVNYATAVPIALLLLVAAFALQPVAVRLVASLWLDDDPPEQVNYTQPWVQGAIVIPMMASACLVAAILWAESTGVSTGTPGDGVPFVRLSDLDEYGEFLTIAWRYWPFPLSVVFVSLWLLSFCSIGNRRHPRALLSACAAPIVAVVVLHALLCGIMLILHPWARNPADGAWRAFVWGPPLVSYAFVATIVVLIGMLGRESTEGSREWWSRLGAWLGIYGFAWMVIAVAAVYGPQWVAWARQQHGALSWSTLGGWLGTIVSGLLAGQSGSTGESDKKGPAGRVLEILAALAPFLFIIGLLIGVSTALDGIVVLYSGMTWSIAAGTIHTAHPFLSVSIALLLGCLVALVVFASRVDINEFSLNAFYRNRLARCYLGASRFQPGERIPQNFTGFDDADDLKLAELATAAMPAGPLHLVNCALNLGGSTDLALHTRHSASLTLSPLHCGSAYRVRDQSGRTEELGYVRTASYGGKDGAPTLGQAISVSGAAASPNMGYHTSPPVAFLLTVFNLRLGWWFPNPSLPRVAAPSPHFSLSYLFAELFGGAREQSRFVMVSDGGHFENLAAYELIRRRCAVVIISDGECDPNLGFEGLGTLIRMCEVDFDISIAIDVDGIRRGPEPWSRRRWAVGRIRYGNGVPDGILIYLKASMNGTEDTSVRQYKTSHPLFPHESTGDQFYGEDQFESYRHLGRDIGAEVFAAAGDEPTLAAYAVRLLADRSHAPSLT